MNVSMGVNYFPSDTIEAIVELTGRTFRVGDRGYIM